MKKISILSALIYSFVLSANAQDNHASGQNSGSSKNSMFLGTGMSSSAHHNVGIGLSNVIALSFVSSGGSTGGAVYMPLTSVSDYNNGVSSEVQQLKVESNREFNVTVNTNSPKFTYSGNVSPAPNVPVDQVLALKVIANATGGAIASVFNNISGALSNMTQNLVSNGATGGHQIFSVQYKTTPGISFPSGTYSVAVVYTASQK